MASDPQQHEVRWGRNLKTIIVCLAVYYLLSAGYGYYTHSALPQLDETLAADATITHAQPFLKNFNTALQTSPALTPPALGNPAAENFTLELTPAITLQGLANPDGQSLQSVRITARYSGALPADALDAIRAFVSACENTAAEDYINYFMRGLGFHPEYGMNEAGKVFEQRKVRNDRGLLYEVSFTPGAHSTLTVSAAQP